MEAFLRDMIDRVEAQIGPIQAEYAAYVELRDSLQKLAKLGAELRQEQLVSKPNGKPAPEERVTLRERILEAMEDRTPRTLDGIVGACQRLGWVTKSTNPKQVVYEQVLRLVKARELKRTGRPRDYRYQMLLHSAT